VIGIYMMISTLGGAVGPPVAQALISSGGWRLYWTAMLGAALLLIALCALLIREPPRSAMEARPGGLRAGAAPPSGYWRIVRSPRFIVLAAAMVVTQTCIMTVSGVTPAHFSRLGWSAAFAARILGIQGLVGTIATGISGWLTERCDPRLMLGAGLLGQSAAMALLGFPQGAAWMYLFALVFGLGWSVSCLAITVLLVRCFGARGGTAALATIFTFAGAAAAGPWAAGMIADATGSFSTALAGLGCCWRPRPPLRS
jgi:predicted MFS family arabinose efflux permease